VTHSDGARGGKHADSEGAHRRRHSNVLSVAAGSSQNYATKPDAKAESIRAEPGERRALCGWQTGRLGVYTAPPRAEDPSGHTQLLAAGTPQLAVCDSLMRRTSRTSRQKFLLILLMFKTFTEQTVSRFYNRSPGLPRFRTLCTLAATMAVPAAILLMLADDYGFNNVRSIFL